MVIQRLKHSAGTLKGFCSAWLQMHSWTSGRGMVQWVEEVVEEVEKHQYRTQPLRQLNVSTHRRRCANVSVMRLSAESNTTNQH